MFKQNVPVSCLYNSVFEYWKVKNTSETGRCFVDVINEMETWLE